MESLNDVPVNDAEAAPPDTAVGSPAATPVEEAAVEPEQETVIGPYLPDQEIPQSSFPEIWAYLLQGNENDLPKGVPLTDIGHFAAEVNSYGELSETPKRSAVKNFSGRVHLVAVCPGRALSHFAIKEGSPEREKLIKDLLAASKDYDGLQIDFENIPARDAGAFLSFLKELRKGLPSGKMFTIALAARTGKVADDPYSYDAIKGIVDRIFVMAYDQHWSTSEPGPVAGIDWCERVAKYAFSAIGSEKLIMGMPFYGRTWGHTTYNRAFFYVGIQRIIRENGVTDVQRENGVPFFTYQTTVNVTSYFDDKASLAERMTIYKRLGINAVGFWCLGQEDPTFWNNLHVGNE
jgi:spore germination protein YaaH